MRNVTLRSGATSVETRASFGVDTRGGAGAGAGGAEANRSMRSSRAFHGSGFASGPPTREVHQDRRPSPSRRATSGRPSPFGSPVRANATQ